MYDLGMDSEMLKGISSAQYHKILQNHLHQLQRPRIFPEDVSRSAIEERGMSCSTQAYGSAGYFAVQRYRKEQERIQKKTFTNWINTYLAKAIPPDCIHDLFVDIRDGVKLVRLLEVLAGVRLPIERPTAMQRAHYLSNVGTALDFLTGKRKIKLVNINPSDVVDGRPAIVLGLIWSIILSFNIDEHNEALNVATGVAEVTKKDQTVSATPSPRTTTQGKTPPVAPVARKKALLAWICRCVSPSFRSLGLQIKDFGPSWRDGRAFCALVHSVEAESLDLSKIRPKDNKANLKLAFNAAEQCLGIPQLLDVEDVDVDNPDERSVMTYVAQFLKEYPNGKKTTKLVNQKLGGRSGGGVASAKSFETSLDAVDSAIDPSLVLSASTVSLHNPKSTRKERVTTPTLLDDEGIRSLLAATSSSLTASDEEVVTNPDAAHSMPNIRAMSLTSPRRQARARTYADLRLARVAKTFSRCRAIANIRVTADRTEETKNAVKIIHIENQIKDSNAQAEEERNFVIYIKELISRIRHEPLEPKDLLQALEEFYQAEQQHQSLTTCLVEMGKRKRQGLLLGILPSELAGIEAKWTQVKPALDEWRWRLDDSLPGDWATVGRWLGQLERCLSTAARLAIELDAASTSEADATTRCSQFAAQLHDLEEKLKDKDRMSELLGLLVKTNTANEPSALPITVVNAIKKRFHDVCHEAQASLRRTNRLYLRWKLADNITEIVDYINVLKNTRYQKLEEAAESMEQIQEWKKSKGLPQRMDEDIAALEELCKESEDKSNSESATSVGEQPGSGLLTIQVKAGGGTLIMRDVAETERIEASMYLSSLRMRWAEALEDLLALEKSSMKLVETWRAYETEAQTLHAWMQEAESKLKEKTISNTEKRFILAQAKQWRQRLNALQDLGAKLIGQSTIPAGEAINTQLVSMLQRLDSISNEVEKSYQAATVETLKGDLDQTLNRMNEMLQAATDLLNREVCLPQTTSMQKAEEATSEYRNQLQTTKEDLLNHLETEYNMAKELSEKLMAAAQEGEIDYSEVERCMQETDRLRRLLQQMAEEKIDDRLSELALAMREAVSVAVRLAQMSEWIEETETVTNANSFTTLDEIMLDSLASIAPDEAIHRLQKCCDSIITHTKALEEAEGWLEELKAKGLKSVNISQLEMAIAETKGRINIMLEQTRKREQLLRAQIQTQGKTMEVANTLETWLREAEGVITTSQESMLPLNAKTIADASRLTQWSLDRLEQQRNAHEAFCEERLAQGAELLSRMDECFQSFTEVWPEVAIVQGSSSDSEMVACAREVVSRVKLLKQRYSDATARLPRSLLAVRFVIIDMKIGEKLMEASEHLRQEELRIESGEEVSLILSEHEAYFFSPDFIEELPAMIVEMEHILEELVKFEPDLAAQFAKRTEVRGKTLFQLKDRAEHFASNMRDLPERWLDFDSKLGGLEQWTSKLENLATRLRSEGLPGSKDMMDPKVAAEIAQRYRDMLKKFEEMVDSSSLNISLAERLNKILQELIAEGGLSPPKMAKRRASLAHVLNSLHDIETVTPNVLQTAKNMVDLLDKHVSKASKQDRTKRFRSHMEEIMSDPTTQTIDSDEMRRLLAEREALIARVNEKKASLVYLMQIPTSKTTHTSQMPPVEERFLQVWEDADRMLEEKAANLRTATQATKQFEEVRNRLFNLLGEAQFLLKCSAGSAYESKLTDGAPVRSYEAFATLSNKGVEQHDNIENIATYGPSKIREQTTAIQTHLKSLEKAAADITKLRGAADLIAEQLGPEKSAELESIINQLERDMALTKSALEERLTALKLADSRWANIHEHAQQLEESLGAQENTLADLRLHIETASLENCDDTVSVCDAYRKYLETCAQDLRKLQSDAASLGSEIGDVNSTLAGMLTMERVDENGIIVKEVPEFVDPEVTAVQKNMNALLLRQKGINNACLSLEQIITSTLAALEEYSKLSGSVETYLNRVEAARDMKYAFSDLEEVMAVKGQLNSLLTLRQAEIDSATWRMRELSPFLKKVPQTAAADAKLSQSLEAADGWLSTRASYIDALTTDWCMWSNEMDKISAELQQLADNVERVDTDAAVDITQRANQAARQLEQVQLLRARWKALRPQTEAVITLLSGGSRGSQLTMESAHHVVPQRYTMVGDQLRDLFSILQDMSTKLEGEFDAQDKFTNDVERLVHMVSVAEKRLGKVTGIWIPSAPTLLAQVTQPISQIHVDDYKPTRDSDSAVENTLDSCINLTEAVAELKSLFSEITGPMRTTIDSLLAQVKQFDTDEATARDRLQYLLREISLLAIRTLKRQYICEVSLAYEQNRTNWVNKLRGLRSLQEQLIQTGATVEILNGLPKTEETPKSLKTIPVDLSYQDDCVRWLKTLNGAKVQILSYKLTADLPKIPDYFQNVEEEVRFEPEYTPQELDTASIVAGIFFVTGRRDEILSAASTSREPFSFYVDVGRLTSDCDRLKTGMVTHWNFLEAYCTSWLRLVRGSEELGSNTTEFLEKTFTLVKSAVDLIDTRLDRPGNHKRLFEITTQLREWQKAFESPSEVENLTDLPLVSRVLELQADGEKLIESLASRTLVVRALLDANRMVLLNASIRLCGIAYQLERLVKAYDSREAAIREVNNVVKEAEQEAGFRSVSNLAANLLGVEVSPEMLAADELVGGSNLKTEISYKSDLESLLRTVWSSQDLSRLLARISKARTYLRTHLPPKLMHLQQSSSAAICAFEAIMNEEHPKPSLERLADDTVRNRIVTRCQHFSDIMDEAIKHLEDKHQAMTLIETNISHICTWIDELLPRVQSATHLLSVSANESAIPEAVQFAETVEDPTDLLDFFNAEREHYAKIIELTQLEVNSDSEILCSVFESQTKSIATRFGDLVSAVSGMEDLWRTYLAQDDAVRHELSRESDKLKVLTDRLDKINLQSGPTLLFTASTKERTDAMELLAQSFEETQQIRSDYIDMITRVEVLSNRCFNRDAFRMRLKRRKLLRDQMAEEVVQEQQVGVEDKSKEHSDSLSKHCANLSFQLASVDTLIKRCAEGIGKRMMKVQADSANAWSSEFNALSEGIEKLKSFVELPLLLKAERHEAVPTFFAERRLDIQESQNRINNLESELSCTVSLHRVIQRSSHYDHGPMASSIGDEVYTRKNRAMLAALRQNLIEYAIHVGEMESLLVEAFTSTSRLKAALAEMDRRLSVALTALEDSLDLHKCEISLAQFSAMKNDLDPIKSELRSLQSLSDHFHTTMTVAISNGSSLISVLGVNIKEASPASQESASYFFAEIASFDKKFHWIVAILDEANGHISVLISGFKQYEYWIMETRTWLHQSEISLRSKLEGIDGFHSLDKDEVEMHLMLIQNLVLSSSDGKRLVNVMEVATADLLTDALEVNRWVGNVCQSPHFHCMTPHSAASLPQFREALMNTSQQLKEDLSKYLSLLNTAKEQAEVKLTVCSTFCDNCYRFIEWLTDCETKWNIPSVGETDNPIANNDMFLWEKQTLVATYKQRLTDVQVHESLLKELFGSTELDYATDQSPIDGSTPATNVRLLDARKRFQWLQKCVVTRIASIEDDVKKTGEMEALLQAFRRSVESINRRFTTLEWEIVELSTWEKLKPVTSEPILEMLEDVIQQLPHSLHTLTELSRELEAAKETMVDTSSSPRHADEAKEMLVKLRNLRNCTEKYIKTCLVLSNSYRTLSDDMDKFKTRISEKAYISELTSPDVCRLTNEEWFSLRNDVLVEQSVLWQFEEELRNESFESKFSVTQAAFDEFLGAINDVAQTSASQCSAVCQFKSKMEELQESFNNCKKTIADYQHGLEMQLSKGDLYHDELNLCQELLNEIGTNLGEILNSASLRGDIKTWTMDTQDLICNVTAIERRLCDFQTKELESLMAIAQSGEEFLPLAAQATQDRWSDLVNRAMNARGAAESALSAVQDAADAFLNMLNWIREAKDKLNAIVNTPIGQPNKSLTEADESRFMADEWSGLAEVRSLRLSKLTKLHSESVAQRKMVLSTTEDLGKLKGAPPSKAEASVIRDLELELADAYADLIDHCQTAVNSEHELLRTTKAALEDANSALNATEKLSDRANSLLFHDDLGASLDWQQTCFNDFISIEVATVRELIDRSKKWVTLLPQPDGYLADNINLRLVEELEKIECKVTERVEVLGKYVHSLSEISQRISSEEVWQCEFSADMNPGLRNAPDTLEKKREMIQYFETKLTEINYHIESVGRLSDDLDRLTTNDGAPFVTPPALVFQLQNLRQSLALQRQIADGQRARWFQVVDQHVHFIRDLFSTHSWVFSLAAESMRCWSVFQDVCKSAPPNLEMISWTREASLYTVKFHEISSEIQKLNGRFALICVVGSGEVNTRIGLCLRDLEKYLKATEQLVERRQSLLDKSSLHVGEFVRNAQRFSQAAEAFTTSYHQVLSASTELTNLVLQTLLEDVERGLSLDLNNLQKERAAVQALAVEACSDELNLPILEPLEEEVNEGVKWEKKPIARPTDPPENRMLDADKVLTELNEVKASLVASITGLYKAADALAVARKHQRQTRKSCQDWLLEASKQLEACRSLMLEQASSHTASLSQKVNSLRIQRRNLEVLLETHKRNKDRFSLALESEAELLNCRAGLLQGLKDECSKCEIISNFALSDDCLEATTLSHGWENLVGEIQALQSSMADHLAKCEAASEAVVWMVEWLRSLEKRIRVEAVPSIDNLRLTLSHRGHCLRPYLEEVEVIEKVMNAQQDVIKSWQKLNEEIHCKIPEFNESERKISAFQSEADSVAQNFRPRLDASIETAKNSLQRNTQGLDSLNQVYQNLISYNKWILAIQQHASTKNTSIPALLGQEAEITLEEGQEHVSSLISAVEHFSTECQWAGDNLCPLSAARLLSADLLSHLKVVWQSARIEIQTLRQKHQSDAEALTDFFSRLTVLAVWLGEKRDLFKGIRGEVNNFCSPSVGTYTEELNKQAAKLPPAGAAVETIALCLKKKEKLVSDISTLLKHLNVKNCDFDFLRERLQELTILGIEGISQATSDTDELMEGYSDLRTRVSQLSEQSKEMLSLHQNLMAILSAVQTWHDELRRSILSSSGFFGDRYALVTRLDWLKNIETVHQKGDKRCADLKEACVRCLATSPSDLAPALLAATNNQLTEFPNLCEKIVTTHSLYTSILTVWEKLDMAAAEFDASSQRFQESLANYEVPYCENPSNFQAKVDMLSSTLDVLNGMKDMDSSASGLWLEALTLRNKFSQLAEYSTQLKSILTEIPTKEDPSLASTISQRSNELKSLIKTLQQIIATWQRMSDHLSEILRESEELGKEADEFAKEVEDLVKGEGFCTSVIAVNDLIERCELCMERHGNFTDALKMMKGKLSSLTPHTNNSTILELQGALTNHLTQHTSNQQLGRSLIKRLKERLDTDAKVKADLGRYNAALSEAELTLVKLTTFGRLIPNISLPKPLSLSTIPNSETNFNFVKFSNAVQEYMIQQKQSVARHNEQLSRLQEELAGQQKEIYDLINQNMLEDDGSILAKNGIKCRLEELVGRVEQVKKDDSACEVFILESNLQIAKIIDELGSCVDVFVHIEGDSRRIPGDFLANSETILTNLNALSTRLNEDAPLLSPIKKIHMRLPTDDHEWKNYMSLYDLLLNEFDNLRQRVEHLKTTVRDEVNELTRVADLRRQWVDLHSRHVAKLSQISTYVQQTPASLDMTSEEKVISQLNAYLALVKSSKVDLQTAVAEYTHKATILLSSLTDTVKSFSSHRNQPVGMLVACIEGQKGHFEDAECQAERMEKEITEEIAHWDKFITQLRAFQQWLLARDADLEATSAAKTFAERTNGLRSLDETLQKNGGPMLDRIVSCGCTLRSLRSNLTVINHATTWITDRHNILLKEVSERRNSLKNMILAEEELHRNANCCSDLLDIQEAQLSELCEKPFAASSAPSTIDGFEERLQKLHEYLRQLEGSKSTHLVPLDERIQSVKNQLKTCGLDQAEVNNAVAKISELWKRYTRLRESCIRVSTELEKLVKGSKAFYKLTSEMNSWLIEQKETFAGLDRGTPILDYHNIHELTDQLANRANAFHRFYMELNSTGERRLADCSSSATDMLNTARSINMPILQDGSSKVHSQETLIADLHKCFQSLHTQATKRRDEISSLLVSLTTYDELFMSLHTWVSSVTKEVTKEGTEDAAKEMQLWSTPSSYLTIRSSHVLSQLAQSHERAEQIGEKQAHLDILLSRSSRLLEEWGFSEVTRFAAQKAGTLSRRFVELTIQVKKQIEQKSMILRNIERLQEARDAYNVWEKDVRGKFARACHEDYSTEVLKKVKRVAKSLDMGDVLLEACRQWALSVQSDALGSKAANPSLVQDLMTSYETLKSMISQKLENIEKHIAQQRAKQLTIASLSSWLEAAEQRLQAIVSSIYTPPQIILKSASFVAVMAFYEQSVASALSELCSLQSECSNKVGFEDDSQLSSRFYAFKVRLAQCVGEAEERAKNLNAYGEASELVSICQKLTLERYVQITGKSTTIPETVSQLTDPPTTVLEALLSPYDAERRLTVLQGAYDELVIDSRQLLETMIDSADRLVSTTMEQEAFLAEVISERNEVLREEQTKLEQLTRKSIELLRGITESWKVFTRTEEELSDWLMAMEQASARPMIKIEMSVDERRQTLAEMQMYQSSLSRKAEVVERHLNETELMNRQTPQFQTAEKAKQLANRYFALVTSVQAQIDLYSREVVEFSRLENVLDQMCAKVEDYRSLIEECWMEGRSNSHTELIRKQIMIKKVLKEVVDLKNSSQLGDLLSLTERVKTFVSATLGDDISRRVSEVSVFLEDSNRRLEQALTLVASRLETWENWSLLVKKLGEELEKTDSSFKLALKEAKIPTSSNPDDVLKKRREAIDRLQELHTSLVSRKPAFNELRRLMKDTDGEVLDPLLYRQSSEVCSRGKTLTLDIQTHRTCLKRSWEGLFAFSNKVNAADQWLLTAFVKLTALNNANPDGPKATEFLIRSCEVLVAEVSHFVANQLKSLIAEGQDIVVSKKTKKKRQEEKDKTEPTGRVDALKHLLNQLKAMKGEAEGLFQVVDAIKMNLFTKLEEWDSLLVTVESGETYLQVHLARWWSERVDRTEEELLQEQYSMTSSLRLKMTQQPETVLEDIVNQIKEIEKRRIHLENASTKVAAPWTLVKTPFNIQRRLQRVVADDSDITSGLPGADEPQTSGSKLRTRVENLQKAYEKEVGKMKVFNERLNHWKSLWDQQLLCEAEILDWIQMKESEANSLFAGRGLDTLDLGTSALKKLHSELIAKREVIDEMAAWRQDLLRLPQQENDPINELNCKIDALVHRIGKKIQMHKNFVSQAQEASQVKAEVQSDLERMVQRLSRFSKVSKMHGLRCYLPSTCVSPQPRLLALQGHSTLYLRSPRAQNSLRTAQSTSVIPQRSPSPLVVQVPSSPVAGSLEWLWYSPTSVLEQISSPVSPARTLVPISTSPSPPRLPIRPHCTSRGNLLGRSTPLINFKRKADPHSHRGFALSRFADIKVGDESLSPTFASTASITSPLPPPPLLLGRSISSHRPGGWRGWWSLQPHSFPDSGFLKKSRDSSSCADLMPSRQTGPVLPSRPSALRATSDIARRRRRKKLEQKRQIDEAASN
ncbi:Nesprin-1 [Echinococcus granulosus]|nr:Nesprin-1 [Echinococcus granulosus]